MSLDRFPVPYGFAKSNRVYWERSTAGTGLSLLCFDTSAAIPALAEVIRCHASSVVFDTELLDPASFDSRLASVYLTDRRGAAFVVDELESTADLSRLMQELPPVEDLLAADDDAPIVRMLNALLTQAVKDRASDIHIEPFEAYSVVRFRIDGELTEIARPNRALHAALISRLKIMAQLDIAEKRLPQDGRISVRLGDRAIDVRVSTLPAAHGERGVLRILDKAQTPADLKSLGMPAEMIGEFVRLTQQPHGLLLVTGPTGSGKTTTLYAALRGLDARRLNILTVEDPIEYELPGIGQTQVNPRIEFAFANALRAILRQDPDIVMIGEIRDRETAQIALQASLTGHLVLATLHTNDAVSAVTRLIDMGVEPFLLSSSLLGVLAQRLVRRLNPDHDSTLSNALSPSAYLGRTGLFELLVVNAALRELIHDSASEQRLKAEATGAGMLSMLDQGEILVASGVTSREELLRATRS